MMNDQGPPTEESRGFLGLPGYLPALLDEEGHLTAVGPAWEQDLGLPSELLVGKAFATLVAAEDQERVQNEFVGVEQSGYQTRFDARVLDRHGEARSFRWTLVTPAAESPVYMLGEPLTEGADRRGALPEVYQDGLTGLPNRKLLMARLDHALARSERKEDFLFAVLHLGLDRFKRINDSLGHRMGDLLLAGVGQTLESILRPTDTLARVGGDEFLVLLEDIADASSPPRVVQRIQEQLQVPFSVGGHEVFTSLSAGVAIMRPDYTDAEQILRDASVALSRAKERGGAGYVIFDPEMHDEAVRRLRLERDLHRAVEREEFQAFYQPVLSLADGRLEGFEALVRWNHPDYGIVPPGQFIPLAEDTGLIQSLGRWIVEEACRQLGAWQAEFQEHQGLSMNVNLSPRQLRDPALVGYVGEAVARNGLASGNLKLEFTESAMMEDPEATPATLEELRQQGATICLDDFGTGYSSLSYLHDLPVDVLKIDRSFVERLTSSERGRDFIQAIVDLGHRLGLTIVAEGIEEEDQEATLREMGCQLGQGFRYSRPVTAEEARFRLLQP